MKVIAVITARGGSKRISHKNIRNFNGKPIIAYSIDAALNSECFDEVMVSTDNNEIAEIAIQYGAKIPFMRSEKNSSDYATTSDVITEVLENYVEQGKSFDAFGCIYPTAPFLTAEKLQCAMDKFKNNNMDSLIPVVKFSYPPQRGFYIRNGYLRYTSPEHEKVRSQDLEVMYHDSGQFYICKTESFYKYKSLVMPCTYPMIIPENEVQDIDTEQDWKMAELKYKINYLGKESQDGD